MLDFLKGPDFALAAFKGQRLTLRDWNLQLRQPILLTDGRVIVSVSPQEGFLHQFSELDTLGYRPARNQMQAEITTIGEQRCGALPARPTARRSLLGAARRAPTSPMCRTRRATPSSVIDTDKWEVVRTIKVGQRPRGIAFTKDEKYVLVAVGDDDTIQMIDTKTQRGRRHVAVRSRSRAFRRRIPTGKILYVANENDNTVTIIDIEKRARLGEVQVGVEPEGMGISPDGKILVNTSETTNMAHFIDTATRQIVANVLVDARPRYAEFKRDGSELWVSSEVGGTVSVIDPVKHEVKKKITFEIPGCARKRSSRSGSTSRATARPAFVALGPANRVAVIDGATHEVMKYLLVGQRVWHMAFTPDEKYLLTHQRRVERRLDHRRRGLKVIKSIQVGELPWGVTISQQ